MARNNIFGLYGDASARRTDWISPDEHGGFCDHVPHPEHAWLHLSSDSGSSDLPG